MKTVSGFVAIFGIAMIINAAEGKWAFHRVTTGVVYVALDAAIALGCFVVSYRLWRRATHEELVEEVRAIEAEQRTRGKR
jgi:TRAP-type C4-dicarboxylate transport system permease small subunit